MSKKGSEKNIAKSDEKVGSKDYLNKIRRTITRGMHV